MSLWLNKTIQMAAWGGLLIVGVSVSRTLTPVSFWPWSTLLFRDVVAVGCLGLLYLVVAWETRSWRRGLLVLVPVLGLIYSARSFYRLDERWKSRHDMRT